MSGDESGDVEIIGLVVLICNISERDPLDLVDGPSIPHVSDSVPSGINSAELHHSLRLYVDPGIDFPHPTLHHTLESPLRPYGTSHGWMSENHSRSFLV